MRIARLGPWRRLAEQGLRAVLAEASAVTDCHRVDDKTLTTA
jgi:hypothetical protein